MAFGAWFLLSNIFNIHQGCPNLCSFLGLKNIPWNSYATFCLLILQLRVTYAVLCFCDSCFYEYLWMLFVWLLVLNSFGYIHRVELLGHVFIVYLTFEENAKVFATLAAPYYIPTRNPWGSQFFKFLPIPVTTYLSYYNHLWVINEVLIIWSDILLGKRHLLHPHMISHPCSLLWRI